MILDWKEDKFHFKKLGCVASWVPKNSQVQQDVFRYCLDRQFSETKAMIFTWKDFPNA